MARLKHVRLYIDRAGYWRYRVVAKNGQIVATPGQSYASRGNVRRAARRDQAGLPILGPGQRLA